MKSAAINASRNRKPNRCPGLREPLPWLVRRSGATLQQAVDALAEGPSPAGSGSSATGARGSGSQHGKQQGQDGLVGKFQLVAGAAVGLLIRAFSASCDGCLVAWEGPFIFLGRHTVIGGVLTPPPSHLTASHPRHLN